MHHINGLKMKKKVENMKKITITITITKKSFLNYQIILKKNKTI